VPIATYLGVVEALTEARRPGQDTRAWAGRLVEGIAAQSVRHAAAVRQAKENRYLWDLGLAPVDVVDLGVVGLATVASRILREAGIDARGFMLELSRLDPIARLAIGIGLDFDHPTELVGV